jgi:hypothetical protein
MVMKIIPQADIAGKLPQTVTWWITQCGYQFPLLTDWHDHKFCIHLQGTPL